MGRCAIVTGGASGIGKAIAEALSNEGHRVVIADVQEEEGRIVAERIKGYFIKVDLSDRESCKYLVEKTVEEFGGVEILINNAGFQHVSSLEEFPEEKWDELLSVMLRAPFLLTKYAWASMKSKGWGRVVNISSVHGLVASPNKVGYVSAKHGLIGLTRAAALEGGEYGITVNALCPAFVRTPLAEKQIPDLARNHSIAEDDVVDKVLLKTVAIKRAIEPKEVADLAVYLCSEKAAAVTGACWAIDLGFTVS